VSHCLQSEATADDYYWKEAEEQAWSIHILCSVLFCWCSCTHSLADILHSGRELIIQELQSTIDRHAALLAAGKGRGPIHPLFILSSAFLHSLFIFCSSSKADIHWHSLPIHFTRCHSLPTRCHLLAIHCLFTLLAVMLCLFAVIHSLFTLLAVIHCLFAIVHCLFTAYSLYSLSFTACSLSFTAYSLPIHSTRCHSLPICCHSLPIHCHSLPIRCLFTTY
jgi:hypothetical protein